MILILWVWQMAEENILSKSKGTFTSYMNELRGLQSIASNHDLQLFVFGIFRGQSPADLLHSKQFHSAWK